VPVRCGLARPGIDAVEHIARLPRPAAAFDSTLAFDSARAFNGTAAFSRQRGPRPSVLLRHRKLSRIQQGK
jgi:hypothetical protein